MSSQPEESHPHDDNRSSVTIEPHENEALKGLLGKGILAGDWSLVKDVAAVLHRIHGVPNSIDTSHIDVDDIINAARLAPPNAVRFPRRDGAGGTYIGTYGRTAGDTPAGEQPYDDDPPLTPGRYGHVSRLDPSVTACARCGAALDDDNCDSADDHRCGPRPTIY